MRGAWPMTRLASNAREMRRLSRVSKTTRLSEPDGMTSETLQLFGFPTFRLLQCFPSPRVSRFRPLSDHGGVARRTGADPHKLHGTTLGLTDRR